MDAEGASMTKLPGADDWPDESLDLSFHGALARRSRPLRQWVGASPRRALSADGMTLFLARRHGVDWDHQGKLHVWSSPTVDGEANIFVIDVFHADADATGYSQSQELAPEVEVLSLDCGDGVLRAVLRLREDQRVALELPEATVDVAWPLEASGGLANQVSPSDATASGYLVHLAELLATGGVAPGTLAREAIARRLERDGRAERRRAAHSSVRERVEAALARNRRVEELGLPQTHAFDQAVARAAFGPHREALRRWARPCWALVPVPGHRASRLGGVPDLPPGAPWPVRDGKLLHFIAQINLADLPALTGVQMPR
jgi:hypothetical protein